MALGNVLARLPGIAGYEAAGQQQLQQASGLASLLRMQQQMQLAQAQEQRIAALQQAQLAEIQRKAAQEQEGNADLKSLFSQFQQMQQPSVTTDAADNVTQAPGMSEDQALRKTLVPMLFNSNPNVRQSGTQLFGRLEASDARTQQVNAQLEAQRQALMLRLEDKRTTEQERAALQRQLKEMDIAARENMVRMNAALRPPREDKLVNVIDPSNPSRAIGMTQSEYLARRSKGEDLALSTGAFNPNQQASRLERLQREMEVTHPNVKLLNTTKPFFMAATEYMSDIAKAKKEGKQAPVTSASDRALYFQFQKMIDPSDKVSEGDIKGKLRMGGVDERFVQYIVSLSQGEMLPDRVRQDIYNAMRRNFTQMNTQVKTVEERYKQRAKSLGLDPSQLQRISEDF